MILLAEKVLPLIERCSLRCDEGGPSIVAKTVGADR